MAPLEHVCPLGVAFVVMAAFLYAPEEGVLRKGSPVQVTVGQGAGRRQWSAVHERKGAPRGGPSLMCPRAKA